MTSLPSPQIDTGTVYWLEDPEGRMPPTLAGRVEYRAQRGELCYFDTQRPHVLKAEFQKALPDGALEFKGPLQKAVLRRLDKNAFDRIFRKQVHAAPAFKDDAELQAFYRKLFAEL